jgi:hypothetical protein
MLIALLAVLGVDLIVLVGFIGVMLTRRRWVQRQPGAFRGSIRVVSGEVDGLRTKWGRGFGRWVRDVLVWSKAPFFFRNLLLAADGLDEERPADKDEVKRLGHQPVVVRITVGGASLDVAAAADARERLRGPYRPGTSSEAPGVR